jgi:multidrug efflux pump subunit AcrB
MARAAAMPFQIVAWPFRVLFRWELIAAVEQQQRRFSLFIEWFIEHVYGAALRTAVRWRFLTGALCLAMLLLTIGYVQGGRISFTFLPKIDGDVINAQLEMPVGTPVEVTRAHLSRMLEIADAIVEQNGGHAAIARGVLADLGGSAGAGQSHLADVRVFLVPSDQRSVTASAFAQQWRQRLGEIPGAENLGFHYSTGSSGGSPVHVRLSHPDHGVLEQVAGKLAHAVRGYTGTYDIDDGAQRGKEQIDLKLRPEARSLGLTQTEVGRQVRAAFYGAEVLRQQRGRDEIRVFVRRPLSERRSEYDIESLMIRTPEGGELPLGQAAEVSRGRAYTAIQRADGRRTLDVTADVDPTAGGNGMMIMGSLKREVLPALAAETAGLSYSTEGQEHERMEMMAGLGANFKLALIAMFALLAAAFRSYLQPVIVLLAIPFGLVGAVLGHIVMGYDLSMMTMFGVVALSGVVVNDSLVLVHSVNAYRAEGMSTFEAVLTGGKRRFRPILLTSLTTFLGLTPMILETSVQARFLIPMAISLGFGVLFSTFIILLLVPCVYMMLEDVVAALARVRETTARLSRPPSRLST